MITNLPIICIGGGARRGTVRGAVTVGPLLLQFKPSPLDVAQLLLECILNTPKFENNASQTVQENFNLILLTKNSNSDLGVAKKCGFGLKNMDSKQLLNFLSKKIEKMKKNAIIFFLIILVYINNKQVTSSMDKY